ncbi:hypothetical protein [Oceaniovalibus sp. ACAM 378]|uniref:hypothetical protein n=1 Tax=Oceaniovalibus sp. ACAM 378 TaxID=2599923 RepID=UPI0011D4454C|nr:hypothetical protein [Oceaniovalibus sp. ACAM 378]TYB83979.1 hypothetical protein FQ320_23455 [Oceaniovalibus sp. ACAM 378]
MSEEHKPLRQMIWERFISKSVDWLVVAAIGGLVIMVFDPVKERAMAIWNTPDALHQLVVRVESLLGQMADVRDDIESLRRPSEVFEVSITNTRPLDGHCVEREPCDIQIKLRRVAEGVRCRIVPGSTQWGFINPRSDLFAPAQRIIPGVARNIGMSWTTIDVQVMTPVGLEPTADFVFEASYTSCPGMTPRDEPLTFQSSRIPFPIRTRAR